MELSVCYVDGGGTRVSCGIVIAFKHCWENQIAKVSASIVVEPKSSPQEVYISYNLARPGAGSVLICVACENSAMCKSTRVR